MTDGAIPITNIFVPMQRLCTEIVKSASCIGLLIVQTGRYVFTLAATCDASDQLYYRLNSTYSDHVNVSDKTHIGASKASERIGVSSKR